jgi:uncharacterized protein YaiI (UPF0178 family)
VTILYIDADACPVRSEAVETALRHGIVVRIVSNGGIRPVASPLVEMVYVPEGPDAADLWIAGRVQRDDVVVTQDIPLAARVVEAGAVALKPDGGVIDARNAGAVLAARDLAADLRAADPFRQGGGRPFSKADRARFKDALDRALRQALRPRA